METPSKEFIKNFMRTVHFQSLESNLNLEQLGKMNNIMAAKYKELSADVGNIEESLKCIVDDYQITEEISNEIASFNVKLDELECSVNVLDDLTTRIESKLAALGKL